MVRVLCVINDVMLIKNPQSDQGTGLAWPRCLSLQMARVYLSVGRRTFESDWLPNLKTCRAGTRTLVDRMELDKLIDMKLSAQRPSARLNFAPELAKARVASKRERR